MNVTELPFNRLIGLKHSDNPHYRLMLGNNPEYQNHLGTVHAGALFTLAEATSGHYLLEAFSDLSDIIPVVRKVEIKYRNPAAGKVYSTAKLSSPEKAEVIESLDQKKRALIGVAVTLHNEQGAVVMEAVFEWFVSRK